MARISTYSADTNIGKQDKVIGTDSNQSETRNYTFEQIGNYINDYNVVSILGQNNFRFQSGLSPQLDRNLGSVSFETYGGIGTSFSDITELIFSGSNTAEIAISDFIASLVNKDLIFTDLGAQNNFAVYRLDSFTELISESGFFKAQLTYKNGIGKIREGAVYGLALYSLGGGAVWGNITNTLTDQTDLVDYIAEQIAEIPTPPTPTLQSVTDEGNTTNNSIAIGRSSATFLLDVGDGTTNTFITKRNPNGAIYIGSSNNTRFGFAAGQVNLGFATGGEDNNVPLALGTFSNAQSLILGTDNLERVRIDGPTGNVGIRTTSPASDLSVSGRADISSRLRVGAAGNPNKTLEVWGDQIFATSGGAIWATFDQSEEKVGIGTPAPSSTLHVAGTIQQTVNAATNQYPIQLYNDHAGTDYYLLRQRVVETGNKVRTGLGITGAPDAAFVLGPQTDQNIKFWDFGSIVNVATISASSTMKINASEIRTGDTTQSSAAHFNITSTNSSSKAVLGLKQGASASNLMIDIRNSSGTPTMGLTSEGGFYFKDSNVVGRYTFDHDYLPSTVDGLTTGFEFRTENASGVLTPFGYIDVTNDNRTLQQSSMRFSVGQSTPTEIMRLESSGNVGVNTASPTSKMHINGTAMVQLRLEQQGGPASNTDAKGAVGDIAYDDLYFYIKTTNGWGRVPLDFGF